MQNLPLSAMTPSWILPIYPLLVTGPLAGTLLQHQPSWAASRIWVAGVLGQGLGWIVTIFLYVLWTIRLLHNDLPDPSHRPGMYIAVGPTGQFGGNPLDSHSSSSQHRLHCTSTIHLRRHCVKSPASPFLRRHHEYCGRDDPRTGHRGWHVSLAFSLLVLWSDHRIHSSRLQADDFQPHLVGIHIP